MKRGRYKMFKRLVAAALLLVLCAFCFVGCNEDDGVPEGMYSVTLEGEPFILYVPGSWTDNRDSGISSAYFSARNAITVAARYYTVGEMALKEFVDTHVANTRESLAEQKLVDENGLNEKSALGKKEATKYEYTFDRTTIENGGAKVTNVSVIQYFAKSGSNVIMLSFYSVTEQLSKEYTEMFEQIRKEFVFCDGKKVNDVKVDKKTPEGMKIASFDSAQYVFYAPLGWECDLTGKLTEAHTPDGKANITVTAYALEVEMTAEQYFIESEKIYKRDIKSYERLSEAKRKVGERDAISYTYKATYGGVEYRIMQTVFEYNAQIYSVTYTATAEVFDSHTVEVKTMLDAFRFR